MDLVQGAYRRYRDQALMLVSHGRAGTEPDIVECQRS